jgi:hypothetical protein
MTAAVGVIDLQQQLAVACIYKTLQIFYVSKAKRLHPVSGCWITATARTVSWLVINRVLPLARNWQLTNLPNLALTLPLSSYYFSYFCLCDSKVNGTYHHRL